MTRTCSTPGCYRVAEARGLCKRHYSADQRAARAGDREPKRCACGAPISRRARRCGMCSPSTRRARGVDLDALAERIRNPRRDWRSERACAGVDPDVFYPTSTSVHEAQPALDVCAQCPVTLDCLAYALRVHRSNFYDFGVWGRTTPLDRRAIRRRVATILASEVA